MVLEREVIERANVLSALRKILLEDKHILELTYKSFLSLKEDPINLAEAKGKKISKEYTTLSEMIIEVQLGPAYINILNDLEAISENNKKIIQIIRRKNKERILFTNKAVLEIDEIFKDLKEMFSHGSDLFIVTNPILANHLLNTSIEVEKKVKQFAYMHEERLAKGICLPIPSIIYLVMLNALSSNVYHLGNIGRSVKSLF